MNALTTRLYELLSTASGTDASSANTTNLKLATTELNKLYKSQPVLSPLLEIALSTSPEGIRQLAAVEARKRIEKPKVKVWQKTAPPQRTLIKQRLLSHLDSSSEPSTRVIHALGQVIAAIAQIELPHQQWPEVMPWLWGLCGKNSVSHRETGAYILFTLLDTLAARSSDDGSDTSPFAQYTSPLFQLVAKLIADPESLKVRVTGVKSLGTAVTYLNVNENLDPQDTAVIQTLIPAILSVGLQCIEISDESSTAELYEQIEVLSLIEIPLISNHIAEVASHCLQVGANEQIDESLRLPALNALLFLIKYKKSKIQSLDMIRPILEGLMPIIAQDEPEDRDEDCPARIGLRLVDVLARALPPATVVQPLMELCRQYATSPNPKFRKAAVAAFGQIFDGCSLYLQPHLDSLWPLIDQSLSDPELIVKSAALIALSAMCTELGDDCAKRHAVLVPPTLELALQPTTQRTALNCLDSLIECLNGEDIAPYLPTLMERLLQLLTSASGEVQAAVVGAIGSAAHAAKRGFTPYFNPCMQHFMIFLTNTNTQDVDDGSNVRGVTQDTVGTLAVAVGKEVFTPFFDPCMRIALEGAMLPSPSLRECSFIFFAVISRVFKESVAPYLPQIMPILIASIAQSEDEDEDTPGPSSVLTNGNLQDYGDADGDDDEIEEEDFDIATALALEKQVAADALGELFEQLGQPFIPYVESSVKALLLTLDHIYEGVRQSGIQAFAAYIMTAFKLSGGVKGAPGLTAAPLNDQVKQLVSITLPFIIKMYETDEEREVVQACCEELTELVKAIGPAIIVKDLEAVCKTTHLIIERKAPCQKEEEEEEEGESSTAVDEQLSEWDAALIRAASDLVGALCNAIGPQFADAFGTFLPAIAKYYDPKRETAERSGAVGALAEATLGLGNAIFPYTEVLFHVFTQALSDPEMDVRSNAAYAIGVLVYASDSDLSSHYLNILAALRPMLLESDLNSDEGKQACDNACGAIARLILKNAAVLPLDQLLPVYLERLPIRYDFVENIKVMDALCFLLVHQNSGIVPYIDRILAIMREVFAAQKASETVDVTGAEIESPLTDETKARTVATLTSALPAERLQSAGLTEYLS